MVDVLGHLGMALIWLAPAWFVFDRRKTALTFVLVGFWFGMLPDIDLYLSNWFPQSIHHHGVVHTILAVTILAAVLGPIVGGVLKASLGDSEWFSPEATDSAYGVGFVAVWVAGLSHLFADMLSAPDIASPIEPLWPLYNGQIVFVDVLYYTSVWATWGLLGLGILVNVAFWAAADDEPA
ncbi:metal-dependent hydrolase [Halobacterium zhouii]|uniref:metal-dependent hydrolase n=1 Tax=Halobacterium zhouii TaxID=2902624 RepID=UPI001E2A0F74|nr:metal-dependent hydrolase [Halobacterium zhouii]